MEEEKTSPSVELEHFTNPSLAIRLQCIICHRVPYPAYAYIHSKCGSFFCKSHIEEWFKVQPGRTCPFDKSPCADIVLCKGNNHFAYVSLLELEVHCVLNKKCKWTGTFSDLETHLQQCGYIKRKCKYSKIGCKFEGTVEELLDHYTHDKDQHNEHLLKQVELYEKQVSSLEEKLSAYQSYSKSWWGVWVNEKSTLSGPDINDATGTYYSCTTMNPLPPYFEAKLKIHSIAGAVGVEVGVSLSRIYIDKEEDLENINTGSNIWTYSSLYYGPDPDCCISHKCHGDVDGEYGEPLQNGDTVNVKYDREGQLSFKRNEKDLGIAYTISKSFYLYGLVQSGTSLEIIEIKPLPQLVLRLHFIRFAFYDNNTLFIKVQ
eukprot:TRINITY_DN1408_c0_g1_i2.p1 TRINITY_DN1408_c0_g1~~TRINITY_DN1408_c0_g1_i2.p1  ORF type:complete len:418 (-),score=18.86 TRINITY_DN1408_c0_g1_i2:52-1173(-)